MSDKPRPSNNLLTAIAKAAELTEPDPLVSKRVREDIADASFASEDKTQRRRRRDRTGTRLIAGHFDPAVARQLRMLAAEEDTTIQALLGEALNLLFVKKGKGKIISAALQ